MSIMVLGGTGTLGRQIVRQALDEGYKVGCLVRNFRRSAFLLEWGVELVYGDLSIPSTLPCALKGIKVVIDSATARPSSNYTAEAVDWRGKIAFLFSAKLANISKIIYVSITRLLSILTFPRNLSIPLVNLQVRIERELERSGINYTIFQCFGFLQGLISGYAVPLLEGEVICLTDLEPIAYLDTQDVAKVIVQAVISSDYDNKKLHLIGEDYWTPTQVIQLCERFSNKTAKVVHIPSTFFVYLRKIFGFFEFTWNIADRLHFSESWTSAYPPSSLGSAQRLGTTLCQPELNWLFVLGGDTQFLLQPLNEVVYFRTKGRRYGSLPYISGTSLQNYLQEYFGQILKKLKKPIINKD